MMHWKWLLFNLVHLQPLIYSILWGSEAKQYHVRFTLMTRIMEPWWQAWKRWNIWWGKVSPYIIKILTLMYTRKVPSVISNTSKMGLYAAIYQFIRGSHYKYSWIINTFLSAVVLVLYLSKSNLVQYFTCREFRIYDTELCPLGVYRIPVIIMKVFAIKTKRPL